MSCYTIIGKICEQLGGAFASRDKLANWQMGVSKWAVPLHHVIDWHIGRLADWCEQVGGAVASLEKLSKFKISKVNMLEYV